MSALPNLLLIGWCLVMAWGWWAGTKAKHKADAACRRVGWRYGYGAGYADAMRGRPSDMTPPLDGRSRSEADE